MLKDLLEKKAALVAKQEALIAAAEKAGRDLTEDEEKAFDEAEKEIKSLNPQIDRYQILEANKAARVIDPNVKGGDTEEYKSFGDFIAKAVVSAGNNGALVPETWSNQIFALQPGEAVVAPRAAVFDTGDINPLHVPALNQATDYFGISFEFPGEGVAPTTDSDFATTDVELVPHKAVATMEISNDLLRAADRNSQIILNMVRAAIAYREDSLFLVSGGTGKPTSILGAPGVKTIARNTALAIKYVDVLAMEAAMLPGRSYVWAVSPSAWQQVAQLTNAINQVVFTRVNGVEMLDGIPVIKTGALKAIGNEGDIMLLDCSAYAIKRMTPPIIAVSDQVYFREDKSVLKLVYYVDGKPLQTQKITLASGDEVSAFVTLSTKLA